MGTLQGAITARINCTQHNTFAPWRTPIPNHRPPEVLQTNPNCPEWPRRTALLVLSLPAVTAWLSIPRRAAAFSISITGPKEWLRDQKKKAARFVLAPIDSSRQSLRNAYQAIGHSSPVQRVAFLLSPFSQISGGNGLPLSSSSSLRSPISDLRLSACLLCSPPSHDLKSPVMVAGELRKLLNSAARDCVPQDRNSFVAFQASTGVEVCTFTLIVKNAASLLDDGDPVKLEAVTRLDDLIRSFSFLGGIIDDSDLGVTSDREKVKIGLLQSISALDNFEQGIKDCLGV